MDEPVFHIEITCRLKQALDIFNRLSELMEHYEFDPGNEVDSLKVYTTDNINENENNDGTDEDTTSSEVRPFGAAD